MIATLLHALLTGDYLGTPTLEEDSPIVALVLILHTLIIGA